METKKRPNEDPLEPETSASTHAPNLNKESINDNGSTSMEVDNPKAESPLILTPGITSSADDNAPPAGETNKRLKLTMETDRTVAGYTPSTDPQDQSKETDGAVERTEKMDNDNNVKEDTDPGATRDSLSGSSTSAGVGHAQGLPNSIVSAHDVEPNINTHPSNPENASNKDSTSSAEIPDTKPPISELSDSITAVVSLPEPLAPTLTVLESNLQLGSGKPSSPTPDVAEPSTTSQSTIVVTNASQINSSGKPESNLPPQHTSLQPVANNTSEDTIKPTNASTINQNDQIRPNFELVKPPSTNEEKSSFATSHQLSHQQDKPKPDLPTDIEMESAERPIEEDTVMTSPRPVPGIVSVEVTTETPRSDSTVNRKDSGEVSTWDVPKKTIVGEGQTSPTIQQQLPPRPSSPRTLPISLNSEVKNLPTSEPVPPPAPPPATSSLPVPQQNIRPRSTMSVSALLVSNDDDAEQESSIERHMSRSIFDQFEPPRPDPSHSSQKPVQQKLPHTSSQSTPPLQQHSQISTASASQAPQALAQPSSSSFPPLITSGTVSTHRISEQADISPPVHHGHTGFNRTVTDAGQLSGRTQDPTTLSHGAARSTIHKEYPSDEVMESGGVGGYGNQRHRLTSPVGIRPPFETTNGASGANHLNTKLPGVGSVTGLPLTHSQDSHSHSSASHRGDSSHQPINGRSSSYSPNQHTSIAHPASVNGQQYSTAGLPGHTSGSTTTVSAPLLSTTSPTVASHHPCLIIKNDPSLKLENRPELFLGFYRYDPSLLLPSMQGKENSLLEVRVASPYLTYDNVKVKRRELWGTEIYTDDSDIVAMLIHGGFFIPPTSLHSGEQDSIQPTSQQHNFAAEPIKHICPAYDLAITLRVMPKLIKYQGSIRHRIKSRTWKTGHDGVSLKIEAIRKLCPGEALNRGRSQSKRRMKEYNQERLRVLANIHDETTESLQNERAMRTATFEFTHQGDPCFKYSPELVMDRHDGLSRKWTSWRLKKEVMILENDEERYEISLQHHAGTDARRFDQYRFAVISPRTSLSSWSKASYPLSSTSLSEVLYEDLDWQDFEWVERGVVVQPSQRAKQSIVQGDSTLMEGVESTVETLSDKIQIKRSNDVVEGIGMEQNGVKDREKDGTRKMRSGVAAGTAPIDTLLSDSSAPKVQDVQQDGVFCVVSRLFWRPITEQQSTTSTNASVPSLYSESRLVNDVEISTSKPRVNLSTAPVSEANSLTRPSQTDVYAGAEPNVSQSKSNASADVSNDSTSLYIQPSNKPTVSPVIQSSTISSQSLLGQGFDTSAMNLDTTGPGQGQSIVRRVEDARMLGERSAEQEEGELEEGEIASE
ncbi:hypothetical protein BGZ80_010534 [Entomortierella chlamydospora]|uniref:Uncharacterized protein n=1 Tax=Entomortierella chlamydospora TaxID=101097 RepID=A0A9P6MUM4_9FUNG|nr:hypothetical protein BGZ80_010534 [Entomortierella chlamydospora]